MKDREQKLARINEAKEAARIELEARKNLDHTTLTEEEIAKTTLLDESIDLDELLAEEMKKKRGK